MRILLVAHSQGGLSSVLWLNSQRAASRRGGRAGLGLAGIARQPHVPHTVDAVVQAFQLGGGKTVMPMRGIRVVASCIDCADRRRLRYLAIRWWSPQRFFPRRVDAGNLDAQAEVSRRLDVRIPVLVCTSDRTMLQPTWDEAMREADSVLDITANRQAALNPGDVVTLATIRGGLHDLSLWPGARRRYFRIVADFGPL